MECSGDVNAHRDESQCRLGANRPFMADSIRSIVTLCGTGVVPEYKAEKQAETKSGGNNCSNYVRCV